MVQNSLSIDRFITKRDIILVKFNYFMAHKLYSEENKIDPSGGLARAFEEAAIKTEEDKKKKPEVKDKFKNNTEQQKFVEEWKKEIPDIEAFIEILNKGIKALKSPKLNENLINFLRMYEQGLKRIIKKCSNEHELILPQDTDNWKRFSEEKGQMYAYWKELQQKLIDQNNVKKINISVMEWKEKIPAVKDAILRIDTLLPQWHVLDPSRNKEGVREDFLKHKLVFEKIVDKYRGIVGSEEVTEGDIKMWLDFIKPNNQLYLTMEVFEKELDELKKPEIKKEEVPTPEPLSPPDITAPPLPTKPIDLPKELPKVSPFIEEKLAESGLTLELLSTIPEFADIAGSEGKIFWMLERFKQVKLRRIKNDATEEFEKENREIRNLGAFAKKIWRGIRRGSLVEMKAQEHAKKDFSFEKYRLDIDGLVHLASASPDMVLKENGGETNVVSQYLEGVRGINDTNLSNFNERATAFANIPPKYEWKNVSKKTIKNYEKIEKEYQASCDSLLFLIPKSLKTVLKGVKGDKTDFYSYEDALNILSNADFAVKMHQSINSHPTAELELKRLAETNGWSRKWDIAKAQLGIAGGAGLTGSTFGFAIGSGAIRMGTKSSLVLTGAAMAAPLVLAGSALFLGGAIGWKRGEFNAKKSILKEEELMRLGMEEKKLNKNGTKLNFISADASVSKISEIRKLLAMEYSEYVKIRPMTLEKFEAQKEEWAEKLQVRIEYTKKKIDEGKISFGKEDKSLANRFHLLQEMGNAKAELALFVGNDGLKPGEIVGKFGRTRRGSLESILLKAELNIEKNREAYTHKQKILGAVTGSVFAGIGIGAGRFLGEHVFGSHDAHVVEKKVQVIKSTNFTDGKSLEKAVVEAVKDNIAHSETQQLIAETTTPPLEVPPPLEAPTPLEVSASTFQYSPDDLKNNSFNILLTDSNTPGLNKPNFSLTNSPILKPNANSELLQKPFEVSLKNEVQSREYALRQYFIHKGMNSAEAGKKASQTIRDMVRDIPGSKGERSLPFVHKGDKVMIFEKDGKVNINVISRNNVVEHLPKIKVEETVVIKDGQQDLFTGKRVGGDSAERAVTRVLRVNAQEYGFKGDIENKMEVRKWADVITKEVLRQNPKIENIVTHNGDKLDLIHTTNGKWLAEVERFIKVPNKIIEALAPQEIKGAGSFSNAIEKTFSNDPRFGNLQPHDQDKFLFKALMHVIDTAQKGGNIGKFFSDMGIKSGNPFNIKNDSINVAKVFDKATLDKIYGDIAEGKVSDNVIGFEGKISSRLASLKNMSPEKLNGEIKKLKAYLWYKGIK